jgi:predicted NAD/FAD-binding protein
MAAALWSAPPDDVLNFPARFVVRFMANHNALTLTRRPPWRVLSGGSATYVRALERRWRVNARLACPVQRISRDGSVVTIESPAGRERFDQLVLACHSDQALALLADASVTERRVLSAIGYQRNEVVLHTDQRLLPPRRRAWAAWNALVPADPHLPATLSYCMNMLQSLRAPEPFVVTLNPTRAIDEERVIKRLTYMHPVFTPAAVTAQSRRNLIQGQRRTWFAGAYWGFGFHEDGMRSAVEVSRALGVHWGPATEHATAAAPGLGALEGVPT